MTMKKRANVHVLKIQDNSILLQKYFVFFTVTFLIVLFASSLRSQGLGVLEEEESFYTNYATESYSKEVLDEQLQVFYDLFGNYITNGFFVYGLTSDRAYISNEVSSDSIMGAYSNEHRDEMFFQSFSNVVFSRDAIGGMKSSFIIGEQIKTKFSPLTFNKRNYEGIRWDLFYEGLGLTTLMSRTRPGLMARSYESGMGYDSDLSQIRDSWVTYPMFGPNGQFNNGGVDWNLSSPAEVDWSARTMYGDYDFLWAFYAHRNFGKKLDVGVSFINHHHSDIKQGEKWNGGISSALAPSEIHFEFYDKTHDNLKDPGVKINDITMTVVTRQGSYTAKPTAFYTETYFTHGDRTKHILVEELYQPGDFPYRKSGTFPATCAFHPKDAVGTDSSGIIDISFDIDVSGNYVVFVSTDRIAIANSHHWSSAGAVKQKTLREISTDRDSVRAMTNAAKALLATIDFSDQTSEVYLGDYILRSHGVARHEDDNHSVFKYHYRIPLARMVYGVDFSGELFNVAFDGEFAANVKKSTYPSKGAEVVNSLNIATYINGDYPLNDKINVKGSFFAIDPEYQPYLSTYQLSRYFHVGRKPGGTSLGDPQSFDYPYVLGNNYTTIDDNEDDDFYVDADRKRFPSELQKNYGGYFAHDGANKYAKRLRLPSGDSTFSIAYDDVDGVISDRYDRNRNGVFDYEEDFLLYSADPPLYDLEYDNNNNNVTDAQEDDFYPDYPVKSIYAYTANGVQSLGVRGFSFNINIEKSKLLKYEFGGGYQSAISPARLEKDIEDLVIENQVDTDEARAFQGFGRLTYRVTRRDIGINIFMGQELKYIQDGIRDDVVRSRREVNNQDEIEYYVQTDPLRYRNAILSRSTASLSFLNFENFEITSKLALNIEKHFPVSHKISQTYTFENKTTNIFEYEFDENDYKETTIGALSGIVKMAYTFELEDKLPSFLHAFKALKIIPQYKLMYSYSLSPETDPRNNDHYKSAALQHMDADSSTQVYYKDVWSDASREWFFYSEYNKNEILSVPIIRAIYPLGEKTAFELGWQLKNKFDALVPENSYSKESRVAQLVITDNYLSFNLSVVIGWLWENKDYTINRYNSLYRIGDTWDTRSSEVYCKIYVSK